VLFFKPAEFFGFILTPDMASLPAAQQNIRNQKVAAPDSIKISKFGASLLKNRRKNL
jgi:hypothetical protein